jgi:hypothetical protein
VAFGAVYTGAFQHHWFGYLTEHVAGWGEAVGLWGPPQSEAGWWCWFDLPARLGAVAAPTGPGTFLSSAAGLPRAALLPPPSPLSLAAAKLCVNQFVVVPLVYMPLFFALTGALGGLTPPQAAARAQALYAPLLQRNYGFWLPVQFVQFLYLPSEWQVPYVCVASLCWTVLLSSIGGSTAPPVAASSVVAYQTLPAAAAFGGGGIPGTPLVGADPSTEEEEEEVVAVVAVPENAVNALTDGVSLGDVRLAVLGGAARNATQLSPGASLRSDERAVAAAGAAAGGGALGLLAAAADGAELGEAVAAALDLATDALGTASPGAGVAVVGAVSAGLGFLAAEGARHSAASAEGAAAEASVEPRADAVEDAASAEAERREWLFRTEIGADWKGADDFDGGSVIEKKPDSVMNE